tara:strand:+ start:3276 stop:3440 length:165 start_codon:yes stop_codon:yes gene_type:complete
MFFISGDTIITLPRLTGESNKNFFKKGYYLADKGLTTDTEIKKALAEYNLKVLD